MSAETTVLTAQPNAAPGRRVPLSVLDLVPIASGSTGATALANTIDLAQQAETFGYLRYWLAEHHLNPGVAGSAPHTLLGVLAARTERIRVGSAATILGNYEPVQVAEAFGTLASLFPGRTDLGIGRSGIPATKPEAKNQDSPGRESGAQTPLPAHPQPQRPRRENTVVDGLVVPPHTPYRIDRTRLALQARLLGRTPGDVEKFTESVADIVAFFEGGFSGDGVPVSVQPAEGSDVELWIHGSSAGESARLAGALGLRFGANYHVLPSGVLDSLAEYRKHFQPSSALTRPHTTVSVDVVVAESDAEAERLAAGYAEWVLSIREGQGAIPYPEPAVAAAAAAEISDEALDSIRDRLDTRFVGSPATVVALLETLQRVTGADELLVTTITHDHADRVNSYRLLAEAWSGEAAP